MDPEDARQICMVEMQKEITMTCDLLTGCRFNDHILKAALRKKKEVNVGLVTVPHSKEHVEALAKAITHGAIFAVTCGDHFI